MRLLVACEYSGAVRDAFIARGHEAMSCDLLPTDVVGPHYQGDVRHVLEGWMPVQHTMDCDPEDTGYCGQWGLMVDECFCPGPTQDEMEYTEVEGRLFARPVKSPHWDMMIAHPPCTYLASSGLHWNRRIPGREALTEEALEFVRLLLDAPIPRIALENPVGRISTAIRKPDQTIQPWWFGDDASKRTCLWLKNLPALKETKRLPGDDKTRRANQTPSGQNKLGPSEDRWKLRSVTYPGIAAAMAEQWGG